jgi:hypothetical protein
MDKQDIIRMAREASIESNEYMLYESLAHTAWVASIEDLERFYDIATAAAVEQERKEFAVHAIDIARKAIEEEREACAKVCETGVDTEHPTVKGHIMKNFGASSHLAEAIRARGEMK